MKINFLGSFDAVQRNLRYERQDARKQTKTEGTPSFQRLLDNGDPEKSLTHPSASRNLSALSEINPTEVMARLSTDIGQSFVVRRDVVLPEIREIPLEPIIPQRVKEAIPPLSPPTLVSIKRYESPADFDRLSRQDRIGEVTRLIASANQEQGTNVPVPLALAVVSTESSFRARSISQDGHATKGLFQFLDSTGREILSQLSSPDSYVPLDPKQNINLGIRYLNHLDGVFARATPLNTGAQTVPGIDEDSRKKLVLAAFNAGLGRVATAQSKTIDTRGNPGDYEQVKRFLPSTTRQYVERVLSQEKGFEIESKLLSSSFDQD